MDFLTLCKNRYSCRKFSDKPVESEKIDSIIEAARLAPTAVNRQPFLIFKMESDAAKKAIRATTKCHFGAETFLLVAAKPEEAWVRPFDSRNFADVDASIVATQMMLAIEDLGLSSTWVGYFDAPKLKTLCSALSPYDLIAIFPIGYAAEDAAPSERHDIRKSPADFVVTI